MKKTMKKYPLLICMIVSCVIIVASLFVAGFCGVKLGTSLGGGSQFEVVVNDSSNTREAADDVKYILRQNGIYCDSVTVEDRFVSSDENGTFTQRCLIFKLTKTDISSETIAKIKEGVADALSVSQDKVSDIQNIVSSIKAKDILLLGLGIGIIAICLFVFGWIRYGIFGGLSFILAYLHNIILFMSINIITRLPLSLVSIAAIIILTLVMTGFVISIYEKYKVESEYSSNRSIPSETMLKCEAKAVKPYIIVAVLTLIFALILNFVFVRNVVYASLGIILALAVSTYTGTLVGPAVYGSLLDLSYANRQASLSRNDTVNKVIKKKIKNNTKKEN